jgi:hypothetical protein
MRDLAAEADEETMLDQIPGLCPTQDVARPIGKSIRKPVSWKPRQNDHKDKCSFIIVPQIAQQRKPTALRSSRRLQLSPGAFTRRRLRRLC